MAVHEALRHPSALMLLPSTFTHSTRAGQRIQHRWACTHTHTHTHTHTKSLLCVYMYIMASLGLYFKQYRVYASQRRACVPDIEPSGRLPTSRVKTARRRAASGNTHAAANRDSYSEASFEQLHLQVCWISLNEPCTPHQLRAFHYPSISGLWQL